MASRTTLDLECVRTRQPSWRKRDACLAMIWRASRSFCKKTFPRCSMIVLHSSIVMSSILARVINREKSSHPDITAVSGCSVCLIVSMAVLIVLCSSWTVSTEKLTLSVFRTAFVHYWDLHGVCSSTIRRVLIAAIPADKFLSLSISWAKYFATSAKKHPHIKIINLIVD